MHLSKRIFRTVAMIIVPFIVSIYMRLLYITSKKTFHLPDSIPNEPIIFAFWHGDLLMQPLLYQHIRKTPHAKIMISGHFDGRLLAKTLGIFHFEPMFSNKESPTKLLFQSLRAIKNGYDIGVTPDGPRGPRHKASDGIVLLSQKMKAPIVFFHCIPTKYRQIKSWDKFVIPKMFGELEFFVSEPIHIHDLDITEAKKRIQEGLMKHAF